MSSLELGIEAIAAYGIILLVSDKYFSKITIVKVDGKNVIANFLNAFTNYLVLYVLTWGYWYLLCKIINIITSSDIATIKAGIANPLIGILLLFTGVYESISFLEKIYTINDTSSYKLPYINYLSLLVLMLYLDMRVYSIWILCFIATCYDIAIKEQANNKKQVRIKLIIRIVLVALIIYLFVINLIMKY